MDDRFHGAKVALFIGDALLVYQRDDFDGLPYPGCWDFPGGGREGEERPEQTVLRETFEEFGLRLHEADLCGQRAYAGADGRTVWFMAIHLEARAVDDIVFGDEGQRWALWSVERFLAAPSAIAVLKERLEAYLERRKGGMPDPG